MGNKWKKVATALAFGIVGYVLGLAVGIGFTWLRETFSASNTPFMNFWEDAIWFGGVISGPANFIVFLLAGIVFVILRGMVQKPEDESPTLKKD